MSRYEQGISVSTGEFKKFIIDLASEKAPGPSTTFSMFHIFFALEVMSKKPIGRNKLAKELGVGEGAIRTIINRLRENDLITTAKDGCSLTPRGYEVWHQFEQFFPQRAEIEKNELTHSDYNYAFLIKNSGQKNQIWH